MIMTETARFDHLLSLPGQISSLILFEKLGALGFSHCEFFVLHVHWTLDIYLSVTEKCLGNIEVHHCTGFSAEISFLFCTYTWVSTHGFMKSEWKLSFTKKVTKSIRCFISQGSYILEPIYMIYLSIYIVSYLIGLAHILMEANKSLGI